MRISDWSSTCALPIFPHPQGIARTQDHARERKLGEEQRSGARNRRLGNRQLLGGGRGRGDRLLRAAGPPRQAREPRTRSGGTTEAVSARGGRISWGGEDGNVRGSRLFRPPARPPP